MMNTFNGSNPASTVHQSNDCTQSIPPVNFTNLVSYCYVLPVICAVGVIGNIANLITLFSRRLKAVSYIYLRGLGIADLLCMIFVLIFVLFEVLTAMEYHDFLSSYHVTWYRAHLMLPLINWTVSAGILIIVALTLERYISVSWPMLFRRWNSPRRAVAIVIAAYIIAMLLYIPMYWQNTVVPKTPTYNANCAINGSDVEGTDRARWAFTDDKVLLNSESYKAYKLARETLVKFLPILALSILNLNIIFVFKKVRKRRRRLNSSSGGPTREQRSLLILLAGIVVLFFICNIPAAINLVIISEAIKRKQSYMTFRAVANLLEITNHALNFYNFCLCSSDYRMTFLRKFPCVKVVQEGADIIKRRLSNSLMRVHGSTKTMNNQSVRIVTSSLRSQHQKEHRRMRLLRRAVSSDALLRDHSSRRRYPRLRGPISGLSPTSWHMEESTVGITTQNDTVKKNFKNDRKYYASAETFKIFDTIPEDTSNYQLGTHSANSANEHKNSLVNRPALSAVELGDYTLLENCMSNGPSPLIQREASRREKVKKYLQYNPECDTLL